MASLRTSASSSLQLLRGVACLLLAGLPASWQGGKTAEAGRGAFSGAIPSEGCAARLGVPLGTWVDLPCCRRRRILACAAAWLRGDPHCLWGGGGGNLLEGGEEGQAG